VLFMMVYMLIDAHRLRNMILLFFPPDERAERRAKAGAKALQKRLKDKGSE